MLCKNCGNQCDSKDKYCPKCNKPLDIDDSKIVILDKKDDGYGEYFRDDKTSQNIYDEFDELKPYYQIQFTKIKDSNEVYKGKFNVFPFLFSWIWMLTKKMYVGAVVYIIVVGLLNNYVSGIFSLIFGILMGLRGNYMYYKYYTKGTYKFW